MASLWGMLCAISFSEPVSTCLEQKMGGFEGVVAMPPSGGSMVKISHKYGYAIDGPFEDDSA